MSMSIVHCNLKRLNHFSQKKKKPRFHSCPLCNAKFATVVEFNKHIQQKHEEVLMDKAVEQKSNETQCMEHTESNEDVTFLFEAEEFKIEPEWKEMADRIIEYWFVIFLT